MMLHEFTFKKGKHLSNPFINPFVGTNTKSIDAVVMFTEKSIYTCKDQLDWNKLCGLSWGFPFNKNAIMWAYRWNTEINSLQLSPYVNSNGENFYLDGNVMPFVAEFKEPYYLKIEIEKGKDLSRIIFTVNREVANVFHEIYVYEHLSHINTNSILVTKRRPYHGGNTTPNNDYSVFMRYL
jgi:hypothetical protein